MRKNVQRKLHRRYFGFMHGYNKHVDLGDLDIKDVYELSIDYVM